MRGGNITRLRTFSTEELLDNSLCRDRQNLIISYRRVPSCFSQQVSRKTTSGTVRNTQEMKWTRSQHVNKKEKEKTQQPKTPALLEKITVFIHVRLSEFKNQPCDNRVFRLCAFFIFKVWSVKQWRHHSLCSEVHLMGCALNFYILKELMLIDDTRGADQS